MQIKGMKIYVASSWKNPRHRVIVNALRDRGAWVYDYRESNDWFHWEDLDPNYERWEPAVYLSALTTTDASEAFWRDMSALAEADAVVGLDPLGVSSALELGWAVGHGRPVVLLVGDVVKPELMAKMIPFRVCQLEDLIITLESLVGQAGPVGHNKHEEQYHGKKN